MIFLISQVQWSRLNPHPLVPHICVSESGEHRLIYSAPSYYPDQYWVMVNRTLRNILQWNCFQNTTFFIHENVFEKIVREKAAILSRGNWGEEGMIHRNPAMIMIHDTTKTKRVHNQFLLCVIYCMLPQPSHFTCVIANQWVHNPTWPSSTWQYEAQIDSLPSPECGEVAESQYEIWSKWNWRILVSEHLY